MPQDLEKRVQILENKVELPELRNEPRQEIRDGDQKTRRLRRVLHEEVLARIETLDRG